MTAATSTTQNGVSIRAKLIAALFAALLRLIKASWSWEIIGLDTIRDALDRQERLLLAFWHGKYLSLFPLLEGFDVCILTSRSFRGQVIADLSRRFGFYCIFVDYHHHRQLENTLDVLLDTHRCLAVAVDGPLGPFHKVRGGLMRLASRLQLLSFPVSVTVNRPFTLKKRWDKMELPLPGSHILIGVGEPLKVPGGVKAEEINAWVDMFQQCLEKADEQFAALPK